METKMTARFTEKNTVALNAKAIKSLGESSEAFRAAIIASLGMAAEHGQCGPLSDLYSKVPAESASVIRQYYNNFVASYGVMTVTEAGEPKMQGFLAFSAKESAFKIAKSEHSKAARANFLALSEENLAAIPMVKPKANRNEEAAAEYSEENFKEEIAKVVTKAAKKGIPASVLKIINDALGEAKVNVEKVRQDAANTLQTQRDNALKVLARTGGVPSATATVEG